MWALSEINFKWLTVMTVLKDHHSVPRSRLLFRILTVDRKHIISLCSAITNTVLVSWHVTVMLFNDGAHVDLLVFFEVWRVNFSRKYLVSISISRQWTLYQSRCSVHHLMLYDVACTRKLFEDSVFEICAELLKFLLFDMACHKLQLTDILICLMP